MKCRDTWVGGIALVVVLLLPVFAHGRPVKGWLFKELEEKANLIVIGTVESSDDAKNWVYENPNNTTWVAVDSVFRVSAVLKGELKKNTLVLRHHRFHDPNGEMILDGPTFVEFDPKLKHRYLMFLKKSKAEEGIVDHFEPLTGQYDPYQSFWLLERYHVTKERVKVKTNLRASTEQGAPADADKPRR